MREKALNMANLKEIYGNKLFLRVGQVVYFPAFTRPNNDAGSAWHTVDGVIRRRNIVLVGKKTITGFTALVLFENKTRLLLVDLKYVYVTKQECDDVVDAGFKVSYCDFLLA